MFLYIELLVLIVLGLGCFYELHKISSYFLSGSTTEENTSDVEETTEPEETEDKEE